MEIELILKLVCFVFLFSIFIFMLLVFVIDNFRNKNDKQEYLTPKKSNHDSKSLQSKRNNHIIELIRKKKWL